MATSTLVGRGVRIEMGITEAAAKTITAMTLADPAVATSVAHGLLAKSLGYLNNISGPVQLEGQAVRFSAVAADTLTLEDIDTTASAAFVSGTVVPVTAWATIGRATGYNTGEGGSNKLDDTVLLDDNLQEIQGLLAAQSVSVTINSQTASDAAMTKLRKIAKASGYAVFRITFKDGNVRFFRGQPGLPGENVQKGAIGTGSFSITVKGVICEGLA